MFPQYSGTQLLRITPEEAEMLNAKDPVEAPPSPYTVQPRNQGNPHFTSIFTSFTFSLPCCTFSFPSPSSAPYPAPYPAPSPGPFPAPYPTSSPAPSCAPSPAPFPALYPAPFPAPSTAPSTFFYLIPRKVSVPVRPSRSGQVFHSGLYQQVLPSVHLGLLPLQELRLRVVRGGRLHVWPEPLHTHIRTRTLPSCPGQPKIISFKLLYTY